MVPTATGAKISVPTSRYWLLKIATTGIDNLNKPLFAEQKKIRIFSH